MKPAGLILLLSLCVQTHANAADPAHTLGKLFLTPERREALDHQREFNLREADDAPGSETLSLDGVVQRSSGRNSVWINQRMQSGADKGLGVRLEKGRPGAADLKLDDNPGTRLKVGESINRKTQERKDVVAPGAVGAGRP